MRKNNRMPNAYFEIFDRFVPFFRTAYVAASLIIVLLSSGVGVFRLKSFLICLCLGLIYSVLAILSKKARRSLAYKYPVLLTVFDILWVSSGIVMSGGVISDFYLIYLLLIAFYVLVYSFRYAVIVCALCSFSYLITLLLTGEPLAFPVWIRLFFIISFTIFTGRLNSKLSQYKTKLATRDSLTSLYNRQSLINALEIEITRETDDNRTVALAFFDIDRFKEINDKKGHLDGDHILAVLGEILKENIRAGDLAARYGGDEFAVFLPDTDKAGAANLFKRINRDLDKYFKGNVTISVGYSSYPEDGDTAQDLINAADLDMYKTKATKKRTETPAVGSVRKTGDNLTA